MLCPIDILKIKGWVILLAFLLIVGPMVALIDLIGTLVDHPLVLILGKSLELAIYFSYPLLVGLKLRSLLSSQARYKTRIDVSLILDFCLVLIPYSIADLVNYQEIGPDVVRFILPAVGLVGFVRIGSFAAREIRSIELKRNAGIWEYASETVQMMYWPLGALWMQPRVNRIADRTVTISE